MSFRLFGLEWNSRWKTLSIYEKFEQTIVSILTWIIAVIVAVATWQLILHTVGMIRSHLLDPKDSQAFQSLFGMVLTLLVALEFKHSLFWKYKSPIWAGAFLDCWCHRAMRSRLEPMQKVARMLRNHE